MLLVLMLSLPSSGQQKDGAKKRYDQKHDNPAEAIQYARKLQMSEQKQPPPPAAMAKAIAQVRELRKAVAQRAAIHPAAMAAFAGRGVQTKTVGGIPVGPLAGVLGSDIRLSTADLAAQLPQPRVQALQAALTRPLAAPLRASINPRGWVWLGPGNIGGRTRSILVHPQQPTTMWLGGVDGGVWRTRDGGATWAPLYDFMANMAVSCMVLDPQDPKTIYAGTGEGFFNVDAVRGFGIFKSTDEGDTWNQLAATQTDDFRYINRLAMASDQSALLVATHKGLFRSTDQGASFALANLRTAPDQVQPFNQEVLDVGCHPADQNTPANNQLCVCGSRAGQSFFSTDGGQTWDKATGITQQQITSLVDDGRVELTYALAKPDVVYASVNWNKGEVYQSTDGGKTFTRRSTPGHLSDPNDSTRASQGWYGNCVWAGDPTDPNLVIVGGIDLWRSSNAAGNFTQISDWNKSPVSAHADHHVIVSHPSYDGVSNRTVFFGNDGGIYQAADVELVQRETGWMPLNHGLGITQYYSCAGNIQTNRIYGGAQDNGTLLFTPVQTPPVPNMGTEGHQDLAGGDGTFAAADPQDPREIFYGSYPGLAVHRSLGGKRAEVIINGLTEVDDQTAGFVAPIVLDPNDATRLLAGGVKLWLANGRDAAPQWKSIKDPLPSPGPNLRTTAISAIAVAQGNSDVIWVGYEFNPDDPSTTGAVFRTSNGTMDVPQWSEVDTGLPKRHCTRLVIAPDGSAVYATFGGYAPSNLWRTNDNGQTWQPVSQPLPEVPFYDVAVHPDNAKILILATEVGIFVSDDGGTTWSPTNQGPTNCSVAQLVWMNKTLVVATHGRGIFKIDLSQTNPPPPPKTKPTVKALVPPQ
jgi:photosystem II stability/assembly factor-like uncharacterized protein